MESGSFDSFIGPLLEREGGYSNRKADRGGPTNRGVTQKNYHAWLRKHAMPERSIRLITIEEATRLYFEEYWTPASCDKLPPKLREIQFDAAVNHGPNRAGLLLQEAAGAKQDGDIGSKTLRAVSLMSEDLLLARYVIMRYRFYGAIIGRDKTQLANISGWMNRMEHFG